MNEKCPACGAILPPMSLKCPECGYVLSRESDSSKAIRDEIRELQTRLTTMKDDSERATVISTFSTPNTKEGLLNLLIFAVNQFNAANGQEDVSVSNAWLGKAKQSYTLLKIQSADDKEVQALLPQYAWINGKVKVFQAEKKRKKNKRIRLLCILGGITIVIYLFLFIVSNLSVEEDVPHDVRAAVMELIREERYDEAKIKAAEAEYSWERNELLELVERAAETQ